jgi:citrate synthase
MADDKVKGPKSYFPSIEKTYGKSISHWMTILKKHESKTHMEMVAVLKTDHEMGHGHANAVVAVFRKENGL